MAATVGAVIALVVWALMQNPDDITDSDFQRQASSESVDTAEGSTSEAGSAATTQPLREQADINEFLAAFRTSRTGTYKVDGRVQVAQAGTDDTNQILFTIVRRGAETIEVAGTTLLVSLDGQTQTCERVFGEDLVCGEVIPTPDVDAEVASLEVLFGGTDPEYLLYADQPGCWQLVATTNPAPAQWGQSTTICFDEQTGAIARQTTSSMQGTRTYVAETIDPDVTDADLLPPS